MYCLVKGLIVIALIHIFVMLTKNNKLEELKYE